MKVLCMERSERRTILAMAGVLVAAAVLVVLSWSHAMYWPDSDSYWEALVHGRFVAHSPGYWLFLQIARVGWAITGDPFYGLQLISAFFVILAVGLVAWLTWKIPAGRARSPIFALYVFSPAVLLLAGTATSHSTDFFIGALMAVLLLSDGWRKGTASAILCFGATLGLAGGLRSATLLLWVPLGVVAMIRFWKRPTFWVATVLGIAITGGTMACAIHAYGGIEGFRAATERLHTINASSSILHSGLIPSSMYNFARSAFIIAWGMGPLWLLMILAGRGLWKKVWEEDRVVLLPLLASIPGPVFVMLFYFGCHPGYLGPLLGTSVGLMLLLASKSDATGQTRLRNFGTVLAAIPLLMFLLMKPIEPVTRPWHAVANSLLLQYGMDATKRSVYFSTSEWLLDAKLEKWIPPGRVEEIEELRKKRETE